MTFGEGLIIGGFIVGFLWLLFKVACQGRNVGKSFYAKEGNGSPYCKHCGKTIHFHSKNNECEEYGWKR